MNTNRDLDLVTTCDDPRHEHRSLEEARKCARQTLDAERRNAATRKCVAKIASMRRSLVIASQLRVERASAPA